MPWRRDCPVIVYEAPNPSPWEDLMQRMANDDLAKQLSCSWGGGDPDPTAEQALIQMALQGQTFFNAVGDSDAFIGPIDFPSDSTNVVQVGGTTLTTTGPLGSYVSETVWNWDVEIDPILYDGVGSSGGISTYYPIPPWQQGVSMANNQGSTTMRNVPDVALTADNVYVRADEEDQDGVGGTSCAAPLWAGFTALVNQQSLAGVHTTVGFLNPALYAIGKGSNYALCFNDITTGNNEWSESPNQFSAVPGYDLCTGWGTPNGTNMINTLAPAIYAPLIVPGSAALVAEGCVPTNGVIDPGETVTVNFGLQNVGTKTVPNVVATLLATGGITSPSGSQNYGTVIFGGPTVSEPFTFTANGTCGEAIKATLQIQTNGALYGTATYVLNLGATSAIFTENFDEVTAPALPAGWTTTAGGAESNWVTSTTTVDTPPNAAFSPDVPAVGSNALVSPVISITSSNAQLTFRNYYNLEAGFDGGVLDIKIGNGPFQDILAAGGWFASGPYNSAISTCCGNPLGGRQAWSGYSGGYFTTTVNLPAVAAGQNIQLRWMCGTDSSGGSVGWYIDTIAINQTACCGSLTPFQLWQIQYFGSTTNPKAAPGYDADGTGQNNEFKFVAGLNPTNPASVFVVGMASVTNLRGRRSWYSARWRSGGRTRRSSARTSWVVPGHH